MSIMLCNCVTYIGQLFYVTGWHGSCNWSEN